MELISAYSKVHQTLIILKSFIITRVNHKKFLEFFVLTAENKEVICPMTTIDHTKLEKIGTFRNNWRARIVTIKVHPTDPTRVITVGVGIHNNKEVVCDESRDDYRRQLVHDDWSPFN